MGLERELWYVAGGASSGGVLVRKEQDTASGQEAERLSTGSFVAEVEYVSSSSRLHYEKVVGGGPQSGWVTTKLKNNDLLVKGQFWEVSGGGKAGGIVVREGQETTSAEAPTRLSTGSVVREIALVGERLHFERLTGSGPATGWVSIKFRENQLVVKMAPEAKAVALDVAASASEKTCDENVATSDGSPAWIPLARELAQAWREGKPYLPPADAPADKLSNLPTLAPFQKYPPKKVKALLAGSAEKLPGDLFGLPLPRTAAQMNSEEFGPAWLTKAFHAAGSLPKNNSVVRVRLCEELPIKGFDTAGGAAMKAFLTVEYARPDPTLCTELFMKYTYDPEREIPGVTQYGMDDGPEVVVALKLQHLFPFRTPQTYFADISRKSSVFLLIMEKIPYAKRGTENQLKPYDVLPGCGKFQDFLLPNPAEYYCCLFRSIGQLAAWDKLGRFDFFFGPSERFTEADSLPQIQARGPKTAQLKENTRSVVSALLDKGIEFFTKYATNLTPKAVQEEAKVQKMKTELVEMCPYFSDITHAYERNNSDYIALTHINLQADNAWFWRDEQGDLSCGVLDWGAAGRAPFCVQFLGCLSGADPADLMNSEESIIKSFVDEYARCGGPKLELEEVLMRYRLAYITMVCDSVSWLDKQVLKETPLEEFLTYTGYQDERFQGKFYTRCGSLTILCCYWQYILRGDMYKTLFDKWAAGPGQPYLTKYE